MAQEEEKVKGDKAEINKKNNEFKQLNNNIIKLRGELTKLKVTNETLEGENNELKVTVQKYVKMLFPILLLTQ